MKMNEPIGDSLYGPLILRSVLGAYFIISGMRLLDDIPGFIAEVQRFGILPNQMAAMYAILLPYFQIGVGGLLVIGFWTTFASMISSLMLISFVIAIGLFPTKFGPFNKDLILLASAISLLYTGAGAFSLDRFRKAG